MKRFTKIIEADKSRFIDKNELLTPSQKEEVKHFFTRHPDQENKIDWNKAHILSYNDYYKVIQNFNERNLPKETLDNLTEGTDYEYLGKDDFYDYYYIKNYKASVILASNNVSPEVWSALPSWYTNSTPENDYPIKISPSGKKQYGGAKWCISMNHTKDYWNRYTEEFGYSFVFAIQHTKTKFKKVAVTFYKQENKFVIDKFFDEFDREKMLSKDTDNYDLYRIATFIKNNSKLKKSFGIQDFAHLNDDLPIVNFKITLSDDSLTYDYPLIKMGKRKEGTVWGGKYLFPFNMPFSNTKAFCYCPKGLKAGKYYCAIIPGKTLDSRYLSNEDFLGGVFTLSKDVPVGGKLYTTDLTALKQKVLPLYVFDSDGVTILEKTQYYGLRSVPTDATFLGALGLSEIIEGYEYLLDRETTLSGTNDWSSSFLRQWLNSEEKANNWWKPQSKFDCLVPDSWQESFTTKVNGFLYDMGISKSDLIEVENKTQFGYNGQVVTTKDYVWLPSSSEISMLSVYEEPSHYYKFIDGDPLEYWSNKLDRDIIDNNTLDSHEELIMHKEKAFGTRSSWWLRNGGYKSSKAFIITASGAREGVSVYDHNVGFFPLLCSNKLQ